MSAPYYPPPAGYPAQGRASSGGKAVVVVAIVVVVALIAAGLWFGIPGTGFPGLRKPKETPTPSGASYANGYVKTWTVSLADFGLTGQQYLWLTTVTDSTWVIQVTDSTYPATPLFSLVGVDAATGAKKWQTNPTGVQQSCASQPIGNLIYCADSGLIYSIDAETGEVSLLTEIYQAGTIETVSGPVTLNATADHIVLEVVGGNLVAFDTDYSTENDFTLISLVEPGGKILWTNPAPIFASCGSAPPPDAQAGAVLVLNSLCMAGVFDARTGKMLAQPTGYVGVAGKNTLWSSGGAGDTITFVSSDGAHWTVYSSGDPGEGDVQFSTSDVVAPLAVVGAGDSKQVAWVKPDGSALWSTTLPGAWYTSTFDGDHLIIADFAGGVWSLSPKDGSILWHTTMPGKIEAEGRPDTFFVGDGVAITQWDDAVDAYSISTGQLHWSAADIWISTWTRHADSMTLGGFSHDWVSVTRIDPLLSQTSPGSQPS